MKVVRHIIKKIKNVFQWTENDIETFRQSFLYIP